MHCSGSFPTGNGTFLTEHTSGLGERGLSASNGVLSRICNDHHQAAQPLTPWNKGRNKQTAKQALKIQKKVYSAQIELSSALQKIKMLHHF